MRSSSAGPNAIVSSGQWDTAVRSAGRSFSSAPFMVAFEFEKDREKARSWRTSSRMWAPKPRIGSDAGDARERYAYKHFRFLRSPRYIAMCQSGKHRNRRGERRRPDKTDGENAQKHGSRTSHPARVREQRLNRDELVVEDFACTSGRRQMAGSLTE